MLSSSELKQITDAVVAAHTHGDFHIDPKEHYDTHARLTRLLDIFDKCENNAWKFIVGTVIVTGFVVSVLWAALHKGGV